MRNAAQRAMMDTGVSMLIPQAYEPGWTRLGDGTFNAYPPQGSSPLDGTFQQSEIDSDATFAQHVPNLFVTYDGPVATPLQLNLTIAPGSGIVFDRKPPGNAIYIRWGTFTNTSGTAVAGGVLHQGLLPVR